MHRWKSTKDSSGYARNSSTQEKLQIELLPPLLENDPKVEPWHFSTALTRTWAQFFFTRNPQQG